MSEKLLPISEYQQRFFLEWALAPEDNTYNIALVYRIKGKLNKAILKQACEIFAKDHEVCHAQYNVDSSKCYYRNYLVEDFFHECELDTNKDINQQLRAILDRPFDLTNDILQQLFLMKSSDISDEYYFLILVHHIIADGYSAVVLVNQIAENYDLLINNRPILININKTFTDAVKAEQRILTLEYKQKSCKYWLNFIDDFPLNVQLPYKPEINLQFLNNKIANKRGEFIYFNFNEQETKQLKEYARKNRSTLFIVLSAIYGLIVSKYSNQTKLLLSYPVNMRPLGYMNIIGCFVNNIPLKLDFEQNEMLDDLISSLTFQRKEIKEYQAYSFTHIIEDQRKYNQGQINNSLNVGFSQTNLNAIPLILSDVKIEAIDIPWSSNIIYELDLQYDESIISLLKFKLSYREALFNKELMGEFVKSFRELVFKIVNHELINCKTYCVLDLKTYYQSFNQYNNTEKLYSQDKPIHGLFEDQVLKTPDTIAVVYKDILLTYKELNKKANQLAHYLRKAYDIKGDDLIALCLDRSEYMLIAILGVLKSGGAYVPMDPSYPDERINFILSDTKAKVFITTGHGKKNFCRKSDVAILRIDNNQFTQVLKEYPKSNPKPNVNISNLAYVIYTSGTTGNPKGVMIEHKSAINTIFSMYSVYDSVKGNRTTEFTSYVFDVSVSEIFNALLFGKELHILGDEERANPIQLSHYLLSRKINVTYIPPILLANLPKEKYTDLESIIYAGEPCDKETGIYWSNIVKLYNYYGPTEASIYCLGKQINNGDVHLIGRPLANTHAYILDTNMSLLPLGVIGELYIGGIGLARGYLNLPELTAKRFIANPFQIEEEKLSNTNSRIYKTGDLVRMLPNGNIEYIGRNDF